MTSRLKSAVARLRERLRDSSAVKASIVDGDGYVLALQVDIVQVDLIRAIRAESEFQLEDEDAAFLVGTDVLSQDPQVGWMIHTESVEYRVTERPELESCWRWHDREEQGRIIFAKEWSRL